MPEAGDELLERDLRELFGDVIGSGFHHDFDPHAKALRIELLVESGPCRPPQIEVEHA